MIVNPKSGVDKNKDKVLETTARLCESSGLQLNIEFTSLPGDARKLAERGVERGVDLVIAAGGDGTVRDVADALWMSDTSMAILPLGSGNGLARSLGIPQDPAEALRTALGGNTLVIDRGRANGKSFYSAFGVGFDAEVSYQFSNDKRRGKTTYIKHAIQQMFRYRPKKFRITSGDNVIETEALLIAVCNCKQYGNNAYIAPGAKPDDGLLDVTVIHSGNFFAKMIAGIDLLSGRLDKNILVENLRFSNLCITEEEGKDSTLIHMDGEPTVGETLIRLESEPRGLRIAVPKITQKFVPVITPVRSMVDDILLDIKKHL